jgi:hypothetical protein
MATSLVCRDFYTFDASGQPIDMCGNVIDVCANPNLFYKGQVPKCTVLQGHCYYRLRDCDTNMTSNTPANQYQKQKLIQKTVRVASSLYAMNLAALNAYVKPGAITHNVNWNQMSDRPIPSVQKTYVPTRGSLGGASSTRHTVTAHRPGAQSPGGYGCDIKHNSYDRYLNRIKGKGPVRRGVIPPDYGAPVPFNPAYPVYGDKRMKLNIVAGCNCPINGNDVDQTSIYDNTRYYFQAI